MRAEDRLRARCRMYLDKALPAPGTWTAIEHGRAHTGDKEARAREWGRLKSQGVKTGIADIQIFYLGTLAAVELKVGKNTTSDAQDVYRNNITANGGIYGVIRSVTALHDWLRDVAAIPVLPSMRIAAMDHDAKLAVPEKSKGRARKPAAAKPTAAAIRRTAALRSKVMF